MNLGAMIVVVVAIVFFSQAYKAHVKAQTGGKKENAKSAELAERLRAVEKRLGNLETIVLDREKQRSFDEAL